MKAAGVFITTTVALLLMASQAFAGDQDIQGNFGTDRVSQLMKKDVKDTNGKAVGEVTDVILDSNGRAAYVVIEYGGVLGIPDRLVPVPVSAFQKGDGKDLVLNIDHDRLVAAPSFASGNWPNFEDPAYDQTLRGYYERSK